MKLDERYEPVIGLEVHSQLLTRSKAFCGCSTEFGREPNSNVCPVCLGLPGVLPVLNRNLVEFIVRLGLATGCAIAGRSGFARKNYFYPDLPKGFQISQFDDPVCRGGAIGIDLDDGSGKMIGITRIHMEEDAGKSIHDMGADTLVDLNRCGVPLIEIVSEPDIRSPREAHLYLSRVRQLVTYLGICDGNMEEGSLRCDANVSVRKRGEAAFGTKTEVKNMNSFRNVERALEFEINRQTLLLGDGGRVVQETLYWDAGQGAAVPMRSKEEAHDYRYFPEPDLVAIEIPAEFISRVRESLPELPVARRDRYQREYGLPRYDADVLTSEKGYADYFDAVVRRLPRGAETAKSAGNWVMTEVLRAVGEKKADIDTFPVSPPNLAAMIGLIRDGTISSKIAKEVFSEMLSTGEDPATVVRRKGLVQISDESAIRKAVENVVARSAAQAEKYRAGNMNILGFFVGEVMKETKGKANPGLVNDLLREILGPPRR
ncbi:MAG TPA: Asp-tRNA(Asn)/Glu-tRNA(Gln) amidotransferase subunit GatB [Bacteroidota bacterium]|nr:Asp-tRNA(Asn)/Glu-tRNA(Gln) amidotransferase subunit GatB [Bacteroidota bacterium]